MFRPSVTRPKSAVWMLFCTLACSPSDASTTDASSSTGSPSTATDTADTSDTDACLASSECSSEEVCVAPYNLDPEPGPGGARGPATCVPLENCIDIPDDLNRWCFDHQGCCGDLRCRSADGVCEKIWVDTTGSDTDSTTSEMTTSETSDSEGMSDTETDTDTETATDTDTDTDTDTETDTDSDSDTTG